MNSHVSRVYASLLLYIVGLNVLVVAAVAVLHELGHATVSYALGCRDITITLLDAGTHASAQMACSTDPGTFAMFLSAFLFILPLSGLFFVLRRFKERFIGHIVLGIGILSAAADLQLLLSAPFVDLVAALIGVTVAVYGEYRLIHGIIATELVGVNHGVGRKDN